MTISTADTDVLSALSNQMADAVARVRPALVLVNGRQRQPASGIVFAPDHVLTAGPSQSHDTGANSPAPLSPVRRSGCSSRSRRACRRGSQRPCGSPGRCGCGCRS